MELNELQALVERNAGILNALLGYCQEKELFDANEFLTYCQRQDYEQVLKECRRDEQDAKSEHDNLHAGGSDATIELCQMAEICKEDYVLDAGTGHGGSARIIADTFGCRVLGIEMDYPRLVNAVFRTKQEAISSFSDFYYADAYHMPFEDESFSAVVRQHAIYGQEEILFLKECFRVLKKGGRIAFQGVLRGMPCSGKKTGMDQFTWNEYHEMLHEIGFSHVQYEINKSSDELMNSYLNNDPIRYQLVKKRLLIGIKLTAYKQEEG